MQTSPTPFDGRSVKGRVIGTFIKGRVAYIHDELNQKLIK